MWASDLLSLIGDFAAVLALAVLVLGRTHSPIAVAVVSAAAFAPAFGIGPLLATVADRLAYRHVMIACDLFRALCYGAILLVPMSLPGLVATVFLAHCASFPFSAARGAQLPQIAGAHYGAAQSLSQSTGQLATLLGAATGGAFLLLGGARGALLVNVLTFLASAALVAAVRSRARTERVTDVTQISYLHRMKAGWASLRSDPLLFWPAVMVTASAAGSTAVISMVVVTAHSVRSTSGGAFAAVLSATLALSTIVAGTLAPADGEQRHLVRVGAWMALASHAAAAALLLLAGSDLLGVVAVVAAYAVLGPSCSMTVPCVTVVGQRLPATNRASVFALLEALLLAGQATGALAGGWAVSTLGAGPGLILLLCPGILVCAAAIGRLRVEPASVPPAA